MNIAIDLRLVQTTTLEVVDVVSYQKQIIGREISAGVFDFLNGNVFDISAGDRRAGAGPAGGPGPDRARDASRFMANLYGAPGPEVCLNAATRPAGRHGRPDRRLLSRLPQHGHEQWLRPARIRLAGTMAATAMFAAAATEAARPGRTRSS